MEEEVETMGLWEQFARLLAGRGASREVRAPESGRRARPYQAPLSPAPPAQGFDPCALSPLALAYAGDAVYELYVRTRLLHEGTRRPAELHGQAVDLVRAGAQARLLNALDGLLTEDEKNVVRRARNARPGHLPKGASPSEYHHSTAFEALLGFLYLSGQDERLRELLDYSWG